MNLGQLLPSGNEPAIYFRDDVMSGAALTARAEEIANGFAIAPGAAVPIALPNGPELVASLFAVWKAGGVYVPINPRLTEREIAHILDIVHGPYDDDIALIQFTSGTTGRPKPVLLRHSGVLELLDGVIGTLRAGAGAGAGAGTGATKPMMPNLIPVSLSLWAGIYQVLFAFRVGAPIVIMETFETQEFARLVRKYAIRSTVLPPAALTMLADDVAITDLAPLKYVRSISAPLSPLQARRAQERFGLAILNGYGQTEIGGEIIGWSAADTKAFGEGKLGAVGRPHAGVDARVDAHTGELQLRTPALSAGYADGVDLSDRLTADGWFCTGDVGHIDDDGFVWIDGRLSDMINRGGLKVFPEEVAEVIRLLPNVVDVAVVGVADERLGEVPWVFVVGAEIDDDALIAHCRDQLAPYKVPVGITHLDAIPRNEIGKAVTTTLVRRDGTQ